MEQHDPMVDSDGKYIDDPRMVKASYKATLLGMALNSVKEDNMEEVFEL